MRQIPDRPLAKRGRLPSDIDGDMPDDAYRKRTATYKKSDDTTDGGPAFPVPDDANVNGQAGMTLRDWFAGQALAGVWAGRESDFANITAPTATDLAVASYKIADAMLEVRKQ